MNAQLLKKIFPYLAGFSFIAVLFFPSLSFSSTLPKIQVVDLLLPFITLYLLLRRKEIVERKSIYILLIFAAYVFVCIAVNSRLGQVRDYFEIFKLIKIALLAGLFTLSGSTDLFKKMLKPVFVGLVLVNLIQFFNLFHVNDFLDDYYMGGGRYSVFGLDSVGHLTYKRMIGLMGNPNDNAILFMTFVIFFFPKKGARIKDFWWFIGALVMMFLCQSRTALLALVPMLMAYAIINRKNLKLVAYTFLGACLSFGLAFGITKGTVNIGYPVELAVTNVESDSTNVQDRDTYLETVVNTSIAQSNSVKVRLEIWERLWIMVKKKPVFGHGPYKEYFYENELYAENQYILMAWRYGFLGLGIYLFFLLHLFRDGVKKLNEEFGLQLLLMVVFLVVAGLTNIPFGNKTVIVLLGMMIGLAATKNFRSGSEDSTVNSNQSNE